MINGESLAAHHTNAATRTGQAEHAEQDVQRISARLRRARAIPPDGRGGIIGNSAPITRLMSR